MDDIRRILTQKPIYKASPKDRVTERGDWLVKFCDRLNPGRLKAPPQFKLKPLSIARMATLLSGVPTGDLYAFWKQCEQAKSFDKYFWFAINPAKHEKKV